IVYILIWILPFLLFLGSIFLFLESTWIYIFVKDSIERLDGFASLLLAIFHFLGFVFCACLSTALTVIVSKKYKSQTSSDTEKT
ncbi:MAG: hypothetical protein ACI4EF_05795, partial [Coprococcus sp.]